MQNLCQRKQSAGSTTHSSPTRHPPPCRRTPSTATLQFVILKGYECGGPAFGVLACAMMDSSRRSGPDINALPGLCVIYKREVGNATTETISPLWLIFFCLGHNWNAFKVTLFGKLAILGARLLCWECWIYSWLNVLVCGQGVLAHDPTQHLWLE